MTALRIADLPAIPVLGDPQLSPDGTQVAYTVTTVDTAKDGYRSAIWLVATDGATKARQLTTGEQDSSPRWSPDGQTLAFVSARAGGAPQLHVLPLGGGEARHVGDLPGGAGDPQWSPDGTSVAVVSLTRLSPETPAHAPLVLDRLLYKADGAGLLKDQRMHLFVLDIATGSHTQLTAGDFTVSGQRWSPDGSRLAYGASTNEDADLTLASAVYVVPSTGGTPTRVTPAGGMLGNPTWFSDGETLLVVGAEVPGIGHTSLFTAKDGNVTKVAVQDRNVMVGGPGYPGGRPVLVDDENVLFMARDGGATHLYRSALDGEPRKIAGDEATSLSGLSLAGDAVAFLLSGASSNGEVHLARQGSELIPLTTHFADALPDVELPVAQSRHFTAPDGTVVQGWVLREASTTGRSPLLLDIHGGPHNAWSSAFDGVHLYHQALVAQGWTVLIVNPRGSDGYGEAFYTAVSNGWGRNDDQDFLVAVDTLIGEGLVDASKVAVTGYSYGGFMTCWLTSRHPDRWAAAIPGGVVSDLTSMAGTADLGGLMASAELGGQPWEAAEELRASSPFTRVGDVTVPTLIVHGAADDRCPLGQAEQWFQALRTRGVPTELVQYPGASHLFILNGRPSHRQDWCQRIVDWSVRHTAGPQAQRRLAMRTAGLRARLEQLCTQLEVPGATVSVLLGDETVTYAAGVRSKRTGLPVTADTAFQIGSNTKVFTATLVMRLVDQGLLDLQAPVQRYVPEFTLADPSAAEGITIWHLLTHTSGIPGDVFGAGIPWGDDAKAIFVEQLADLAPVHPAGELWSYSNAGWVLLGRVVEKVTGLPFAKAWQQHLVEPLGLTQTFCDPNALLSKDVSVGHLVVEGQLVDEPTFSDAPASCSAGSLPAASGPDVLAFVRMHLDGGGEVLSPDSVAAMQEHQVDVPQPFRRRGWGLGWGLGVTADGRRMIGHGGATAGSFSTLEVVPEDRFAVAVLTNAAPGLVMGKLLVQELMEQLLGTTPATTDLGDSQQLPPSTYEGWYEAGPNSIVVTAVPEGLSLEMTAVGLDGLPQTTTFVVEPRGERVFVAGEQTVLFLPAKDGDEPAYLFTGRAHRRVS